MYSVGEEQDYVPYIFQATLNYPDCAEVMRRWMEHLSSTHMSQQVSLTMPHPNPIARSLFAIFKMADDF